VRKSAGITPEALVASDSVPTELSFPPIRRLGPADLTRCVALSVDRGWSPERAKWSLLLAASEVFGVDAPDGHGLAGSVTLTRWDADYAAVGMMLVAARYERRGLGRALMEHLLRAAGDGAAVTLFATDMGRPLYEKLGFAAVRANVSFVGRFRPPSGSAGGPRRAGRGVRAATEADLPGLLDLDRAAFGADRGNILARLPAFADRIAVVDADGDGAGGPAIAGYAAAWRNTPASTVIGPLVAPDGETARRLVTALAAAARTPVRLDLDPDRPELPGWVNARGLEPVGRTLVMARGGRTPRGTPGRLFAPISVALA
jgi:GNAT superfamily N-acetyltransferase